MEAHKWKEVAESGQEMKTSIREGVMLGGG